MTLKTSITKYASSIRVVFVIALALRLLLPWFCRGFRYMDEHWQVIEPAGYLMHGTWSKTVEWQDGLRSWIYPFLVSLPMRAAEYLGIHDPLALVSITRSVHGVISVVAIPVVWVLSRSILAAWFVALWPFALYSSTHTHGEMIGAIFVLLGIAAIAERNNDVNSTASSREWLRYALAGFFFSLSFMLKIDNAVAGLGFGLWVLLFSGSDMKTRITRAGVVAASILPVLFVIGLVDHFTWGTWFQSILGHAKVNLVDGVGNQWGVSPWYIHIGYFIQMIGPAVVVSAFIATRSWRRLPTPIQASWFVTLFFVAVFCTIPHKEKRFLAPILYTGIVATFYSIRELHNRKLIAVVLAATAFQFAVDLQFYIFQQPWWGRVRAVHMAGQVPVGEVEKVFSPLWPLQFYLPRGRTAEIINADDDSLARATKGLQSFSAAVDWPHTILFERQGFQCQGWPGPRPAPYPKADTPMPWAYVCKRVK